jgi:hypothetical protein
VLFALVVDVARQLGEDTAQLAGILYRGSRLEAVIEALPERGQQLNSDEQAFVDASKTARDAGLERELRNSRRLRRRLTTAVCLLVLAVVAGTVAFIQREQARTATTRARLAQSTAEGSQRNAEIEALVGRSLSIRGSQRDTAALLAIEAFRLKDTPRTRSALLSTFTSDVGFLGTDRLPESLGANATGAVLPDGHTALVSGTTADSRVYSYDLDTGALGEPWPRLLTLTDGYGYSHFISSDDGRLVAQIIWIQHPPHNGTNVMGVFDSSTHELLIGPIDVPLFIDNAVFSPDNSRIYASGGPDGSVVDYSVLDGSEIGRLAGLTPPADSPLRATTVGLAFVTGGLLAVGSAAGPVRLVDPLTLEVRSQIDAPRGTTERFAAIDHGRTLIGSGIRGRVRLDLADPSQGPRWEVGPF